MTFEALLALAILKGSSAIVSGAALAAPAAHAPTTLTEAVLASCCAVADSGAVAVDAPPTKSAAPVLTVPWPTEELMVGHRWNKIMQCNWKIFQRKWLILH